MSNIVIDNAMVERAAIAAYEADDRRPGAWTTCDAASRIQWRKFIRASLKAAHNPPQRRYTDTPREERRKQTCEHDFGIHFDPSTMAVTDVCGKCGEKMPKEGEAAPSGAEGERGTVRVAKEVLERAIGYEPQVGTSVHWRYLEQALGHELSDIDRKAWPPIVAAIVHSECQVGYQRVSAAKPEPRPCLTENPMKETIAAVVADSIPVSEGMRKIGGAACTHEWRETDHTNEVCAQNIYRAMRAKEIEEQDAKRRIVRMYDMNDDRFKIRTPHRRRDDQPQQTEYPAHFHRRAGDLK